MIETVTDLRTHYPDPKGRALHKVIDRFDGHCRRFVALSPFVVLATADPDGRLDASPRGGAPGFVRIPDDQTLWLPDAKGNNRLDSLTNVVETGRAGLLFLIPGIDETLRVNGSARLRDDARALEAFDAERHRPRIVLEVTIEEAYVHCAKALMRSALWNPGQHRDRSVLPPTGQILNDHSGANGPVETQEAMRARYAPDL